ncbi:hypothetical protein NM688_g4558 [Phlebia brevispora]|uniref:Uncharacterized protein n=1 Tax=Phlebia brevispora TaxID=194682 RepID=A0ACC1T2Y2_9APHY|nr:hypothetical protein NM688_g4558 [Phlebia brevispora]
MRTRRLAALRIAFWTATPTDIWCNATPDRAASQFTAGELTCWLLRDLSASATNGARVRRRDDPDVIPRSPGSCIREHRLELCSALPRRMVANTTVTASQLECETGPHALVYDVARLQELYCEEAVYRACVLSAYHMAGSSTRKMIFLSPLWFGLGQCLPFVFTLCDRLIDSKYPVVQLAYTTLFGFHCAFLFLRTGSLLVPIASHAFCNIMGLPGFASDLSLFPQKRIAIAAAYIGGVIAYIYTLRSWTAGYNSMYWPA